MRRCRQPARTSDDKRRPLFTLLNFDDGDFILSKTMLTNVGAVTQPSASHVRIIPGANYPLNRFFFLKMQEKHVQATKSAEKFHVFFFNTFRTIGTFLKCSCQFSRFKRCATLGNIPRSTAHRLLENLPQSDVPRGAFGATDATPSSFSEPVIRQRNQKAQHF